MPPGRPSLPAPGPCLLRVAGLELRPARDSPGRFDHCVLSIFWSPHYCALPEARDDTQQCAHRRYGFVVHGLWPQRERDAPAFCRSRQPRMVKSPIVDRYLPIMPSPRLIEHPCASTGAAAL